jgi:hypothetical protein
MVVWKEVEVPLPLDEQHRWDQLVGYNILDTVGCNGLVNAMLAGRCLPQLPAAAAAAQAWHAITGATSAAAAACAALTRRLLMLQRLFMVLAMVLAMRRR